MNKMTLKAIPAALMLASAASAFALTPGSGAWVKETATYGTPNLQNAYVYVPKNTAPAVKAGKRALMLSLHGCAMTATNVINKGFNWETTAEQYGMVVVAPTVPSGTSSTRSYSGCWDWFGSNHTRSTRDEAVLIKLINAIKARAELDIDPNQIYVTGLSSGGGVTNTLACVAPDIFAGFGANAGPAMNTPSTAGVGSKNSQTAAQISSGCKAAATSAYESYFATQIGSTVHGTSDTTVDPSHSKGTEDGMKVLYGASTSAGTITETNSTGRLWKDANGKIRFAAVDATGMKHAWPAGSGGSGGGTYVDYTHVNYPAFVTKYFFDNNLRVVDGSSTTTSTTTSTTSGSSTSSSSSSTSSSTTSSSTTTSSTTTTTAGACFSASNYAHVTAGRAYQSLGYAYANGSAQKMGLYNLFTTTKLRQTGSNYYVIDSTCP